MIILLNYKIMEEKKEKRVLTIELDDDVKKVSITGIGDDDKVVMMQREACLVTLHRLA